MSAVTTQNKVADRRGDHLVRESKAKKKDKKKKKKKKDRASRSSFKRQKKKDKVRDTVRGGDTDSQRVSAQAPSRGGPGGTGVARFKVEGRLPTASDPVGPSAVAQSPIAKLAADYGLDAAVTRPQERILKWVQFVTDQIGGARDVDRLINKLMKIDIRRQVFLLEGVLKFYEKRFDTEEATPMESARRMVKDLEDYLGDYSDFLKLTQQARDNGFPPQAIAELEKSAAVEREKLKKLLLGSKKDPETHRWVNVPAWIRTPGSQEIPAARSLIDTVTGLDFGTYAEDRGYVQSEFNRRLKKLEKSDFDMTQLQAGVHEFRRQLRWFPVYAEALDGLIVLTSDQNPVKAYEKLLKDDLSKSKFVKLPPPDREEDPIYASLSLYTANMKAVLDFGGLKDRGEHIEFLAEAYKKAGLAPTAEAAHAAVRGLLNEPPGAEQEVLDQAGVFYKEIQKNKLLRAIRREIKAG